MLIPHIMHMNIFVYTRSSWDERNAIGNTLSNWFDGSCWKNDEFYSFYMREAEPRNNVCKKYYRVTIKELITHFFTKEKIGKYFELDNKLSVEPNSSEIENKLINGLHRHSLQIVYSLMERLCYRGGWINKKFIEFLRQMNPDIFFATAADNGMLSRMIDVVKENTKAKIVVYIADDIYGQYKRCPFYRKNMLKRNFERIIENSDYIYGASEVLCAEYGKTFNRNIVPLYKGCRFSPNTVKEVHSPVRITYAGNLLYGREEILGKVADELVKLHKEGLEAQLNIYSGAERTDDIVAKLQKEDVSFFRGRRSYDEIKKILSESDIVLHVESFEQKQIDYVHYSFSTKIMDCLQSGSTILGIGPSGIASIEYLRNVDGAIVIDSEEKIGKIIKSILLNKDNIPERAQETRRFALKRHDINCVQNKLRQDFLRLL